jgi:iron complex transport system substrate-binding protein
MRIASFLASGTEICVALGLQDRLVAISHECDWPPDVLHLARISRPRFDLAGMTSGEIDRALREAMQEHGTAYEIDEDRLAALRPDVVLTQAVCEVCAVPTPGVRDVVARRDIDATVISLDAHTIADILRSIEQVGAAAGVPERAADVVDRLQSRIDRVRAAVAGAPKPSVLAIEWLDPPFAPGHWVPEMIELAGGRNLVGRHGSHSEQLTWDALRGLDPDVLLVMPCGYGLEATRADADAAGDRLRDVAPRAIDEGRAYMVDGSAYFNRSGPRFVTGIEIVATLLHRDRFAIPLDHIAERWPTGPRPVEVYQSEHC